MHVFVTVGLYSACLTGVGSGLFLLALSYMGTGFGFGDLKKDLLKLAAVSVLVGAADGLCAFLPMPPRSSHVVAIIVHWILLKLLFFENLSSKETFFVVLVTRLLYFIVAFILMVAMHSNA